MASLIVHLHRHLTLSFQMLLNVLERCPDNLWVGQKEHESIWKRVFHALESIDFWIDDFSEYRFPEAFNGFSAEMNIENKSSLTKRQLLEYSKLVNGKISGFINGLTENNLTELSKKHPKTTYLDIILSQIRHIQVNIGYCNQKMIEHGIKGVEWVGYNE
jgi:hypothetical protein